MHEALAAAAAAIRDADAVLVTAGAGMGVDSGLPDFRGSEGFWRAYPAYAARGLRFEELANPRWFAHDPHLAWGFYGHRLNLYRVTTPHAGFGMLRRWGERKPLGCFVFTSNVDGQFQRAGFDPERVVECHGSILQNQCAAACHGETWPAGPANVAVEPATMRAADPLPTCPRCGGVARPNILMFGDGAWIEDRTEEQYGRFHEWIDALAGRSLAIVECGAGTAVPTVRMGSERIARAPRATLVRINVREPEVPRAGRHISLPSAALAALTCIDQMLSGDAPLGPAS